MCWRASRPTHPTTTTQPPAAPPRDRGPPLQPASAARPPHQQPAPTLLPRPRPSTHDPPTHHPPPPTHHPPPGPTTQPHPRPPPPALLSCQAAVAQEATSRRGWCWIERAAGGGRAGCAGWASGARRSRRKPRRDGVLTVGWGYCRSLFPGALTGCAWGRSGPGLKGNLVDSEGFPAQTLTSMRCSSSAIAFVLADGSQAADRVWKS